MSGKIIWKLALALIIAVFSISYLVPLKDRDYGEYLRSSSDSEEFYALLDRAEALVTEENNGIRSLNMALKSISTEERINLSEYFPQVALEASLRNIDKRNKILLTHLLDSSKASLKKGLDIAGGIAATMQIDPAELAGVEDYEREEKLSKAIEIIEKRVNEYGLSEPIVRSVGADRLELQLPDASTSDDPTLLEKIKAPAQLEFREVHPTAFPGRDPAPFGFEPKTLIRDSGEDVAEERLYVKVFPALTGKYVTRAVPVQDQIGGYKVSLAFDDEGAKRFADITATLGEQSAQGTIGRLAIVLDGELQSAPTVRERIGGGSAEISGSFTQRDAIELANILNNPLEFKLEVAELYEVGPTLAEDSITSGVNAAKIGIMLVAGFMLLYYMLGGVVALISVSLNIAIVLGVLASFDATITLPGIAGIILTVGMAVDANILIFERIREELKTGKSLKSALHGGFEKVFSTIFDANVTTLLVSLVMLGYGTGPVKGFGLTLAIGVGTTVFCALIVSRMLLELLIETEAVKKFAMLSIVKNPAVKFLKYRKVAFFVSWTVVAIGIVGVAMKSDTIYGIDFTGGDEMTLSFEKRIDEGALNQLVVDQNLGEVVVQYVEQIGADVSSLKVQTPFEGGRPIADAFIAAFPEAAFEVIGENQIGPSIGDEIKANAIKSIALSLALILLYIAIRFEIGYGVGAVVATIHDILLTIGIFVLFDHQFTAPMIAAILLIVGYSLNDTIVVFDRIREELQLRPTTKLGEVINIAINAVLSRSLLTSITTLLAAGSLMIFGTGVINDIAFTFTIGICTGTFSSIFIASPIFFWWHKGDRRSVEKSHDVAPEYEWQASSKASN